MFSKTRYMVSILLSIALISANFSQSFGFGRQFKKVQIYDDVKDSDLSGISNKITKELLVNIDFNERTIWPSQDMMPEEVTPEDLIEYGKDPGLGLRELHDLGYTGNNVHVALFDQPLLKEHDAYQNVEYTYKYLNDEASGDTSMHGAAVMSLLAGKDIGVAPDTIVHYYAYPSWLADQKNEADLFYDVIERNKTLPCEKQIRIISMSHGVDKMKNSKMLAEAEEAARKAGIIVLDVNTTNINPVKARPFKDKNDPNNYTKVSWGWYSNNGLYVPTGRTTADGYNLSQTDEYIYWEGGGLSWAVPYIAGVIALGLQIDPTLTETQALQYLYKSGYNFHGGKLINPKGFIDMVEKNYNHKPYYYYILYNSNSVDTQDYQGINEYAQQLSNDEHDVILKDVKDYKTAKQIYKVLQQDKDSRKGFLKGIQIFGLPKDVPSFSIHDKVDMGEYGIHDLGDITTDYFYSNLDNDINLINKQLSMYKIFDNNITIDLTPQWMVSRLPVGKGDIHRYYDKYLSYTNQIKNKPYIPLINFSSPIFASSSSVDDFSYFIKNKLDQDFKVIKDKQYKLYGNTQGLYPVRTSVIDDISQQNLSKENNEGIMNLVINSHGQPTNIDQSIFVKDEDIEKFEDNIRQKESVGNGISELRISLLNKDNVNSVLDDNYYNLFLWNCWGSANLEDTNIASEMINNGQAVNIISSSYLTSNNGINNASDIEELQENNPFYLFYNFVKNIYLHQYKWSEAFHYARVQYVKTLLKNKKLRKGNYQFNLNNAIAVNHIGLIERTPIKQLKYINYQDSYDTIIKENQYKVSIGNSSLMDNVPVISYSQDTFMIEKDNGIDFMPIEYRDSFQATKYKVEEVSAAVNHEHVYIKLKYDLPRNECIYLFLIADTPGLKHRTKVLDSGKKTVIFQFRKEDLVSYKQGLAFHIGSFNYIFIDKKILDEIARIDAAIKLKVAGEYIALTNKPTFRNGTVVAPAYTLLKSFGCNITWQDNNNRIIAKNNKNTIEIINGSNIFKLNGKVIELSSPVEKIKGVMMLPVRTIAESMGYRVSWNNTNKTVIINTDEHPWLQ